MRAYINCVCSRFVSDKAEHSWPGTVICYLLTSSFLPSFYAIQLIFLFVGLYELIWLI